MTNTLKRLLDRELIMIRPDPKDGRRKRVIITEKGLITRDQCIQLLAPLFVILKKCLWKLHTRQIKQLLAGISKQIKLNFRDFSEIESISEPRFVF
jgi:DNA-binding MarR family transcriptional regulator